MQKSKMEKSNLLIHNTTLIWLILITWWWLFQGSFHKNRNIDVEDGICYILYVVEVFEILVTVRAISVTNSNQLYQWNKLSAWEYNAYVAPIKIVNPSDVELPNFTDCQTSGYGYTQEQLHINIQK